MKRCLLLILAFAMLTGSSFFAIEPAEGAPKGRVSSEIIAPGVTQELYNWPTRYGNARIGVWKCDLNNPKTDLRLVAGAGSYTKRATVGQMTTKTNAVAMMNGDYFNMALQGSPIGPSIVNGRLQSSPAVIVGLYSLGIDKDRKAHIEAMVFKGQVVAANGKSFPIDGLNKTYYWHDPSGQESHTNTIQLYNDFWSSSSRGHKKNSEALVNANGIVEKISYGKCLPYAVPKGKYILQMNGNAELFFKKNIKVGSKINLNFGVYPDRGWTFLVGGHALVLDQGKIQNYTKDINVLGGVRARSAAGISNDGKTICFVAVEGRTNRSAGLNLPSLGLFMQQLGCYKAVNLDGGGSTTMISRPLGSFNRDLTIAPERYGAQRPVVNGVGIFNKNPVGPIAGVEIGGPAKMVIGESAGFPIIRAWDGNYHPKQPSEITYQYHDSAQIGAWAGQWMLALKPGKTNISAGHAAGALGTKTIQVLGAEGLKDISIKTEPTILQPGSKVYFTLYGKTTDGREIQLSPKIADFYIDGFEGTLDGQAGTFLVSNTKDLPAAQVIAKIGQHQAKGKLKNKDYRHLEMFIGQKNYFLNGLKKEIDVPPVIINNRTLVPLRFITEAYGGQISWNGQTREIHLEYKDQIIEMIADDTRAKINGELVELDVPPRLLAGRTIVPVRFISENLNMLVDYDGEKQSVYIAEKMNPS